MSRTVLVAALFSIFSLSIVQSSTAQFNMVAGLNYGQLSDLQVDDIDASFESASGWNVGVNYYLNLGIIGIRPGILYRQFGDVTLENFESFDILDKADLTFIDVPVDLVFRLGIIPVVKPYILAGAVFSFPSSSDEDLSEAIESNSISASAGLGVTIALFGVSVSPEVRYEFGVTKLLKEEVDGTVINNDPPSSVILRVGIGL